MTNIENLASRTDSPCCIRLDDLPNDSYTKSNRKTQRQDFFIFDQNFTHFRNSNFQNYQQFRKSSSFKILPISKSVPIATPSDILILRYYTYLKRVSNTKKSYCLEMSIFQHFEFWNLENQNIKNCRNFHIRIMIIQNEAYLEY